MPDLDRLLQPAGVLLAAVVGLLGVIVGGFLTSWHQRRLEKDKAINARAEALAKELSSAVQQLTINIASAVHSMTWLTWLAKTRPDQLTQARIDKYDDEQHSTLPKILGYLSTSAALDTKLYELLRENVREVFSLDAEIGELGLLFKADANAAAEKLAALHKKLVEFETRLPQTLGDILGARLRIP